MSLEQLDAFLAYARQHPELNCQLHDQETPLDLAAFLALTTRAGFAVDEADVIAAQQREEECLSAAELQERAGVEARRLRNFIYG